MLRRLGFTVLPAADGLSAVEIFRQRADDIDCILLDLTMPNMDGERTFHELYRIRPEVPTIVMSGYTEEEINSRFEEITPVGFLQKPFQLASLGESLRKALSTRRQDTDPESRVN
jgi:CheY-like chemotaxis protein